jgi:hypothetical protein
MLKSLEFCTMGWWRSMNLFFLEQGPEPHKNAAVPQHSLYLQIQPDLQNWCQLCVADLEIWSCPQANLTATHEM